MILTAKSLMADYIDNTESYWCENRRQAQKSESRIISHKKYYQYNSEEFVQFLSKLSDDRMKKGSKTLYLPSYGSSGSHLIQHLIVQSVTSIPLGEVYVPIDIERKTQCLSVHERYKFMEMYHLSHSTMPWMTPSRGLIINTAHKSRLQFFADNTRKFDSVFIFRHPVNLVLSRTFRKSEYRSYLGKGYISDKEYLDDNIKKTINFYKSSLSYRFGGYIRFEDLFSSDSHQYRISKTISEVIASRDLSHYIKNNIQKSIEDDKNTNKYEGEQIKINEEYVEYCKGKLRFLIKEINEMILIKSDLDAYNTINN